MKLSVNGEEKELPEGLKLDALIEHLGLDVRQVAVELNSSVVRRARYAEHDLRSGDRVEIVTFVGGG